MTENNDIVAYLQEVFFHREARPVGCKTYPRPVGGHPDKLLERIKVFRNTPCVVGRSEERPEPTTISREAFSVCLTPENIFTVQSLASNGLFVRKHDCMSTSVLEGWCPAIPGHVIQNGDFIKLSPTTACVPTDIVFTFQFQICPSQILIRPARRQELEAGHMKRSRRKKRGKKEASTMGTSLFGASTVYTDTQNPYTVTL